MSSRQDNAAGRKARRRLRAGGAMITFGQRAQRIARPANPSMPGPHPPPGKVTGLGADASEDEEGETKQLEIYIKLKTLNDLETIRGKVATLLTRSGVNTNSSELDQFQYQRSKNAAGANTRDLMERHVRLTRRNVAVLNDLEEWFSHSSEALTRVVRKGVDSEPGVEQSLTEFNTLVDAFSKKLASQMGLLTTGLASATAGEAMIEATDTMNKGQKTSHGIEENTHIERYAKACEVQTAETEKAKKELDDERKRNEKLLRGITMTDNKFVMIKRDLGTMMEEKRVMAEEMEGLVKEKATLVERLQKVELQQEMAVAAAEEGGQGQVVLNEPLEEELSPGAARRLRFTRAAGGGLDTKRTGNENEAKHADTQDADDNGAGQALLGTLGPHIMDALRKLGDPQSTAARKTAAMESLASFFTSLKNTDTAKQGPGAQDAEKQGTHVADMNKQGPGQTSAPLRGGGGGGASVVGGTLVLPTSTLPSGGARWGGSATVRRGQPAPCPLGAQVSAPGAQNADAQDAEKRGTHDADTVTQGTGAQDADAQDAKKQGTHDAGVVYSIPSGAANCDSAVQASASSITDKPLHTPKLFVGTSCALDV